MQLELQFELDCKDMITSHIVLFFNLKNNITFMDPIVHPRSLSVTNTAKEELDQS